MWIIIDYNATINGMIALKEIILMLFIMITKHQLLSILKKQNMKTA